jgi:hypothetical protein
LEIEKFMKKHGINTDEYLPWELPSKSELLADLEGIVVLYRQDVDGRERKRCR